MSKIDLTGRIGVHKVALIFLEKFGWIEREQTITDVGIDMQVEIVENSIPTGQLLALQIKCGKSYFEEEKDNNIIFRGKKKHLEYWTNYSLPVFIILHNPITNKTYWQRVIPTKTEETAKGWKIAVPYTQSLSVAHKENIVKFYQNTNHFTVMEISDTSHGLNRRVAAKILVENTYATSRATMRSIIPKLNENLKSSDYHRNEITKSKYKDKPAEVISIFFYDSIMQIKHGLTFCRTIWHNPQCEDKVNSFTVDETVKEIDIKWDVENEFLNEFIKENQLSKGAYLELTDRQYNEISLIIKSIEKTIKKYQRNHNFTELIKQILTWKDSIEIMDQQVSTMGYPPVECQDIDEIIHPSVALLHNIIIIANDQNRDSSNIIYLINSYLENLKQKVPFYEYERKKIN
jgi:hypothetical protein